jgi:hypothetical protein
MRIALEMLRTKKDCTTSLYDGTVGNQGVSVRCSALATLASDIAPFALVVTAEGLNGAPSFTSEGTASQPRAIGGNVYLSAPPGSLEKPVAMTDGDLWYYSAGGCAVAGTGPSYPNLTFRPANERGYTCTARTWRNMFPQPPLPPKNGTTQRPTGTTINGCTVFAPGVYDKPPVIGSGTQNFFRPGTYSFEFAVDFHVKNAVVVGGVPGTSPSFTGSSPAARNRGVFTFATPWCASEMEKARIANGDSTGVTWVFTRTSRLVVDPNGKVELFAPGPSTSDAMRPSVVALEGASGPFAANTSGTLGSPLIDIAPGSNNGLVIHGGVWAPFSTVTIGNIAQAANGQFMGGIVVGRMNMQAAANVGNFNLRTMTRPVTKRVLLTSVAGSTSTTVVALVRAGTGSVAIQSWRVQ